MTRYQAIAMYRFFALIAIKYSYVHVDLQMLGEYFPTSICIISKVDQTRQIGQAPKADINADHSIPALTLVIVRTEVALFPVAR